MIEAAHIIVYGRVQGVWFRAGTKEQADELGLLGWVKNRAEGTVEIHAEGEKPQLEKFITWCRKGTPAADVTSLGIVWITAKEFKSFDIH
ncbi:MAG: acylphosphatase [Nitrospinales bacterium]|jgi:acylphosphatase